MAFKRIGFGQVEPNQLSAQKTGQIYASLPLDENVKVLQNGEFMYYDYSTGKVTAEPGVEGQEPMLVFNEIKIYDNRFNLKDFAIIRTGKDSYVTNPSVIGLSYQENYGWTADQETYGDGSNNVKVDPNPKHSSYQDGYSLDGIAPRLFKTNIGDVYTTNMVITSTPEQDVTYNVKDILTLKKVTKADGTKTLVLAKDGEINTIKFVVAKVYTMPDGQQGLKIQRIQ